MSESGDPQWWSQPFAPEGSAAAEGISNQLGRPPLDPLEILVREAAQNSWDARLGTVPVSFRISVQRLGGMAEVWHDLLAPGAPTESTGEVTASLSPESIVLVISDRGTAGLGGPIRAGVKADPGERSDFVQFLRNVGEPRDTALGGGTYGFGKGIFFRLSAPGMILADSRASEQAEDRRLMGAAIGASFFAGDRRFTGRHWWGPVARDGIPDPLLGHEAQSMAQRLGLPRFADTDTGTNIVVIGAILGTGADDEQRSPMQAAEFMASAILWHLWPKMVGDADRRMQFSIDVDGTDVPIPDPQTVPVLAPFAESLMAARAGGDFAVTRKADPKEVGQLAVKVDAAPGSAPNSSVVSSARPFDGPAHHVARMRQAELVVDYREGPPHPNPSLQYGGVFLVSAEADRYFASAEPPTHDDWIERGLTGTSKGVVQGARQQIQKRLTTLFEEQASSAVASSVGLATLSARLGSMLDRPKPVPTEGGAGRTQRGKRPSPRGAAVRVMEATRLMAADGRPFLVSRIRLRGSTERTRWMATSSIRLDGGAVEVLAPTSAERPQVLQWTSVDSQHVVRGAYLELGPGGDSEWWVYAEFSAQAVVDIEVKEVV